MFWKSLAGKPPNGLASSGRQEGVTPIDRKDALFLLDAKIAAIQPIGCARLFGDSLLRVLVLNDILDILQRLAHFCLPANAERWMVAHFDLPNHHLQIP
jgi:hypothetical protein